MARSRALFDELMFPGGKAKAFTLSYDDGTVHDRPLVEILNRYGIKGTFNLNSGFLGQRSELVGPRGAVDTSKVSSEEVGSLYAGHEVAGHGYNHASALHLGVAAYARDVLRDREALEELTGSLVRGYAYPFGHADEGAARVLEDAGYCYGRTIRSTGSFGIPKQLLLWDPTCHHNDPGLMELAKRFCRTERFDFEKKLFFVWGHSYEFAADDSWDRLEELCRYMADHGTEVWFASNIEICDYIAACRRLQYSADGSRIRNPSCTTVWLRRGGEVYAIAPGITADIE